MILLTSFDAARALGMSRPNVAHLVKHGKLTPKARTLSGKILFDLGALLTLAEARSYRKTGFFLNRSPLVDNVQAKENAPDTWQGAGALGTEPMEGVRYGMP